MRWLLGFAVIASCSSSSNRPITLAPTIVMPQDLLAGVTKLTVSVYDPSSGSRSCDATNGTVTGLTAQSKPLATEDLSSSNCASGAGGCGSLSIDQSGNPRLFAAQAFVGTASAPVASGCTSATPNVDTVQVTIKMLRSLPPSTCNGQPSTQITQCSSRIERRPGLRPEHPPEPRGVLLAGRQHDDERHQGQVSRCCLAVRDGRRGPPRRGVGRKERRRQRGVDARARRLDGAVRHARCVHPELVVPPARHERRAVPGAALPSAAVQPRHRVGQRQLLRRVRETAPSPRRRSRSARSARSCRPPPSRR